MEVTKVVDQQISDRINTQHVAAQFEGVNAGVVFWCTEFDDEPDEWEWIGTGGRPGFAILVPYSVALSHPDIDGYLVELVRQRVFGLI